MVDCISCGKPYDMATQDMFCPHGPLNKGPGITPDRLRVTLKSGNFFDLNITAGFDLKNFMATVLLNGYVLNERVFVERPSIETVFTWITSQGEPFSKDSRNIRLAPGTETKQ